MGLLCRRPAHRAGADQVDGPLVQENAPLAAVAYLVLVYHTLVLVKPGYWAAGRLGSGGLLVAGTASAVLLLAAGPVARALRPSRALTA